MIVPKFLCVSTSLTLCSFWSSVGPSTLLTSQLDDRDFCLRESNFFTGLFHHLIVPNVDYRHLQMAGDDMFIPKEIFSFIMKN